VKAEFILRAARELIVRGWTQKTYARNADGRAVPYGGPGACSWCMSGAVKEANCADPDDLEVTYAFRFLKTATGGDPIAPWNDEPSRTKEGVLAAFDIAIDLAAGIP